MAEETLLPADALQKNAPKVIPPLAGFWFRFGALLLDIFILRLVVQVTLPVLRPLYLSVGQGAVVFELILIFVYLFLAEGPVGKGKTVGKAILGIRTTTLAGEPISTTAAAIRAVFFVVMALRLLPGTFELSLALAGDQRGLFAFRAVFRALIEAYLIANVFLVVLDPLKRTLHDRAAQTLVVREAGEHNLEALLEAVRDKGQPLMKRAVQVGMVAFVALGALRVWAEYNQLFSVDTERGVKFLSEFNQEFAYGPFRVTLDSPRSFRQLDRMLAQHGVTTDSLTVHQAEAGGVEARPSTDSYVLVFAFHTNSAIMPGDFGTREEFAGLVSRAVGWCETGIVEGRFPLERDSRIVRLRSKDGATTKLIQPTHVVLLFAEQIGLILIQSTQIEIAKAEIVPLNLPQGFYDKERESVGEVAPRLSPVKDEPLPEAARNEKSTAPAVRNKGGP